MKEYDKGPYRTADLYLAAFLYANSVTLVGLEHQGAKGVFIFADGPRCRELALDFYNAQGTCDAREYSRAVQELKAAVFNI